MRGLGSLGALACLDKPFDARDPCYGVCLQSVYLVGNYASTYRS
jgi:hypothetical protein